MVLLIFFCVDVLIDLEFCRMSEIVDLDMFVCLVIFSMVGFFFIGFVFWFGLFEVV